MPDYYIRTPEQDESRGPFNIAKLRTLAEADQVSENTLFYDEDKEEWIPIALNEELKAKVFPKREKLSLKIQGVENPKDEASTDESSGLDIDDILKAAGADTKETRHLKKSRKSLEKAAAIAPMSLGLMMLMTALSLILPHLQIIQGAANENGLNVLVNYPFFLVGAFDLIMAILLLLSVTEVYPIIRGRAMLGLGFGVYVGWAIGDPILMLAFGLSGLGLFFATFLQKFTLMVLAVLVGLGSSAYLAFLAANGRFSEFYSVIQINLTGS